MLKKVFKATPIFVMSMIVWLLLGSTIVVSADWVEADGSRYYVNESGENLIGFQRIGNSSYFFDEDGKMCTSKWITTTAGTKYYFKQDGTMATGKVKIGKNTYYFGQNGKMRTSKWVTMSDGTKYYFKQDGTMAIGKIKIGDKSYEFDSKGKLIVSKLWNPYNGVKWDMSQSEVIEALNLKEDDYELHDSIILTVNEDEDILGPFFANVYFFTDEKLIAIGSCGIYSEENLKILKEEFEREEFIFITSQEVDTETYCYYINKNNTGAIVYSEDFIMYFITSDSFLSDIRN